MKTILFLISLIIPAVLIAQAKELPTAVVAPFKNSSGMKLQSTESIEDTFISLLLGTKRLSVMERGRLKDVTPEMYNSGEIGVEGANYIFLCNISTLDVNVSKKKVPLIDVVQEIAEVKVQFNVRVVDVETSKVMFSTIGKAEDSKKITKGVLGMNTNNKKILDNAMVNDVMQEALKDTIEKIINSLFPVKIMLVKKNGTVYINRGKPAGVIKGQVFLVYKQGEDLVDEDTGINLGSEEEKIGAIRITEALAKFSKAEITDGKIDSTSKGALCRKPQKVIIEKKKKRKSKKKRKKLW